MFVGIDVAKAELVVSLVPSAERFTVANDERGVRTLVERLRRIAPTLIVLEATGGYELLAVAALAAAALPVGVVNPRQVRDFAKATGQFAKTDRIDAASSRASPTSCGPRCGRSQTRWLRSSTRSSRGGASCSRCSRPSAIGPARSLAKASVG
jgi:hypothetical protein